MFLIDLGQIVCNPDCVSVFLNVWRPDLICSKLADPGPGLAGENTVQVTMLPSDLCAILIISRL